MNDTPELFPTSASSRDKPPGKIGGCVGTFLQLFDWNPRKRLFSTKRLPAERPNGTRKVSSKRYKDERMPVAKLLLLAEEENRGGFPSPKKTSSVSSSVDRGSEDGAPGKRVPGVVARLMGLESLPVERVNEGRLSPQHPKQLPVEVRPLQELLHTRQEPVLLSDLLREREFEAQKLSLKDRLNGPVPGFVKKLPEPVPQMNYIPPKDGFKKPLRSEPHLQPYADPKYQKGLRPLKRTPRDLTDPKHLMLALSPRASGEGMRPILLPSKVHNKLMNSPIKSPTKMGSRSARLLEAAVKILEPSLQSSTTRARVPPSRHSSGRDYRDIDREVGIFEERREKLMAERKVALSSNAARTLKGQNMSRSWNGREETGGRYGGSLHDAGAKRRTEQSHSRGASPLRASNRSRSRSMLPQEEMNLKVMEEIKTVVPQGFEEAYGGGLKPLNVGRKEELRQEKLEMEDRKVSEKHIVSSLSSLSSLSVGNSPYSECSERSTTSSFQDPLRRSGSAKEGPSLPTPTSSKSRFMRSKSVKEEKSSKMSGGGIGAGSHHNRTSTREMRVKQEIPQQAHQVHQQAQQQALQQGLQQQALQQGLLQQVLQHGLQQQALQQGLQEQALQQGLQDQALQHGLQEQALQQALQEQVFKQGLQQQARQQGLQQQSHQQGLQQQSHHQALQRGHHPQAYQSPSPVKAAPVVAHEPQLVDDVEVGSPIEDARQEPEIVTVSIEEENMDSGNHEAELSTVYRFRRASSPEVVVESADESVSSASSHASAATHVSSSVSNKDASVSSRSSSGGGLLSYTRLFGSRKSGERKSDKEKKRSDVPRKSESSLVRSLLRRKPVPQAVTSPSPAPVQSMDKPKKRGKKYAASEPASREASDAELAGYHSEDYAVEVEFDMAAVIQANKFADKEGESKERVIHADVEDSPSKSVDDVYPEVPLDKGCLRLLDEVDETGSQRLGIEGFDCVEEDDVHDDIIRDGILDYAAQLIDDLKLEEMFSTGSVIQGAGRNGFSYSPLVELEEPPRSSLESFILDGGTEVEKCVSFLGRTGDESSPELSFIKRELLAEAAKCHDDKPRQELQQQARAAPMSLSEPTSEDIEEAKASLLSELSEARKIVDDAFDEATERVAKKLASKGSVVLAGVDGGEEAVCASAVVNDDCGQPSPVSVLDCPFEEDESRSSQGNLHESTCETEEFDEDEEEEEDEDALIDDLLLSSATAVEPRQGRKVRKKVSTLTLTVDAGATTTGKTQTEKIVDAILDISRIRCIDPSACGLVVENSESFQEEEEDYVRKILSVWEVFPEASGNGTANSELPIASTLFDRLESQGRASAWKREKEREEFGSPYPEEEGPPLRSFKQWQGLWLHRRLLFDCVNETLAYSLKYKYPEPWMGIPILRPPPAGKDLVKEVYSEMRDWREVQAEEELDTIIEMDMGRGFGNWSNLNQEIGEIGLEIERTLLRVMIEDLVSEIMGVTSSLPKCQSTEVA